MGEVKTLSPEEFRRMQLMQTDMLVELDRVCRKHNITYSLTGGTLLGAVRHKGYIPWDDDADVGMLREEYEKFKKVAHELDPELCYFQDHTTDDGYRWGYGKLRRTGTRYVRVGQEHMKGKTGVFIDIFPIDDVPKTTLGQMFQDFYCFLLRTVLWSEVGKYSKTENGFVKFIYKIISHISPKWAFARSKKMENKSRNDSPNRCRVLLFPATGKLYKKNPIKLRYGMEKQWYADVVEYDFEGHKLFGTRDYDGYLSYTYGDYMTLPPEEKRVVHAPVSDYEF